MTSHGRRRRPRHRHHLVQGRGLVGVAARPARMPSSRPRGTTSGCGRTEIDPYRLVDVAVDLIGSAVRAAESAWGPGPGARRRRDRSGRERRAARRGRAACRAGDRLVRSPRRERDRAAGPGGPRIRRRRSSARRACRGRARPAWPSCSGCAPADTRPARPPTWLSVPEWIVFALGGDPVREPSLASRTGLIDQGTGQVWPQALAAAGLPARILPEERAGRQSGRVPAARRCRLLRRGRRPDGGRARPSGGGRRRRRGRAGRAVQLQRHRGRAGPVHPRDAAGGRAPAGRDGRLVARAARAAGHQPAPGRGQRRAAAAARAGGAGRRVRAGPVGARSRQPERR